MHSPFPEAIGEMDASYRPKILHAKTPLWFHDVERWAGEDGLGEMVNLFKHQLVGGNSGEPVYVPRSPDAEEGDGF